MSDLVKKARELGGFSPEAELCSLMADEIVALQNALRPLAKLFLYPDDLGFEQAADIREDPDWDEDANDMETDDFFLLRRDIRRARKLLKMGDE